MPIYGNSFRGGGGAGQGYNPYNAGAVSRKPIGKSPEAPAAGEQPYQRDAAGGSTVNRYSAQTRKAAPISKEQEKSDLSRGVTPRTDLGSQTQYKVSNDVTSAKGATMGQAASDYRAARKQGMSPDDARGQAISGAGNRARMSRDARGNTVR